jgi:hypothetical protein
VSASTISADGRIASLDQFRGYTVLGMIIVNCIGGYAVVHSVFKHNDNYFSSADSIMPSFHFAVGCSYRLMFLRRSAVAGATLTRLRFVRRAFALIAIAVLFFGAGGGFRDWQQFYELPATYSVSSEGGAEAVADQPAPKFRTTFVAQWRVYLAHLLKSRMWNTFAIIGATQLVILPFIGARAVVRLGVLIALAIGHLLLTAWFNWGFVLGDPHNWMVIAWKTGSAASWDGGFFGPLCWAVTMLGGTLAYDVLAANATPMRAGRAILVWGCAAMLLGYALSCLTTMYDVSSGAQPDPQLPRYARSPFVPDFSTIGQRPWSSLLAEPPLVAPPAADVRLGNYWMMTKQIPSLSFILFATGFAASLYAMFVVICDGCGLTCGLFGTFGRNPLAAYVIHDMIGRQLGPLVPSDSPLWYCLLGLLVYVTAVYACVRSLERANIFIRV